MLKISNGGGRRLPELNPPAYEHFLHTHRNGSINWVST